MSKRESAKRRAITVLACLVLALLVLGSSAHAKRVALVIGNSAYEYAPALKNPRNDAQAMSAVLQKLGFEVVTGIDLTHRDFARTVGQFRKKLKGAEVGLFFYAGH
ncbi:MAG: caspase family protein, partial [Proteobacteria bacterium]|nr:caspase family protein [Pseudomonadota bacterium]